jgi:superfamily II DNA or RNA helicase
MKMNGISLRPYQVELKEKCLDALDKNRVLLQLPTGGGKTIVFASVAEDFIVHGERVLVLAHRQELITQAADKLRAVAGCPVGIVKAGIPSDFSAPIQVASVQSMRSRLRCLHKPDLIIIDEAHHSTAASYRRVLESFPEAFQLGVTATPCRADGSGFDGLFDVMVHGPTVQDLINEGHLSPYRLFANPEPMKTKGARSNAGDYRSTDLAGLNPVVTLSGNLVSSYRQHCPGKRCIVFAVNVEHSRAIADRYTQSGIPAAHLDGESSSDYRAATLAAFAAGELLVLSNVGLFTEGFDLPALDAVQIARPTKSLGLWLQMLGRALRPAPGKDYAVLIDHTDNWQLLGLPTAPMEWSLAGVRKLPPEPGPPPPPPPPPALVEIVETDDEIEEIDIEAHLAEQLRFAKEQGYRAAKEFSREAIMQAIQLHYPGHIASVCTPQKRIVINSRHYGRGNVPQLVDTPECILQKIVRYPDEWSLEVRRPKAFTAQDFELSGINKLKLPPIITWVST